MPEQSPRQRFSEAASRVADLEAFMDHAREGLATIQAKADAASLELQQAEAALHEAEQGSNDAQAALRRAMGDATQPSVTELRHSLDAKRAVYSEIARERELCRRQIEILELNDLARAEYAKREALGAFLASSPEVKTLVAELHASRKRTITIEAALSAISKVPRALPQFWHSIRDDDEKPDPALAAKWRAVIEQLLVDPAAEIPGGDPTPQPEAAAA